MEECPQAVVTPRAWELTCGYSSSVSLGNDRKMIYSSFGLVIEQLRIATKEELIDAGFKRTEPAPLWISATRKSDGARRIYRRDELKADGGSVEIDEAIKR